MDLSAEKRYSQLLDFLTINNNINNLSCKDKKKVVRKLKIMLKEVEFLKRTGGVTLVACEDIIITAYHNNSMNRRIRGIL